MALQNKAAIEKHWAGFPATAAISLLSQSDRGPKDQWSSSVKVKDMGRHPLKWSDITRTGFFLGETREDLYHLLLLPHQRLVRDNNKNGPVITKTLTGDSRTSEI